MLSVVYTEFGLYNSGQNVWLGGWDKYDNDTFYWLDGSRFSDGYTNWMIGQPNHGGSYRTGIFTYRNKHQWRWFDFYGGSSLYTLCEVVVY